MSTPNSSRTDEVLPPPSSAGLTRTGEGGVGLVALGELLTTRRAPGAPIAALKAAALPPSLFLTSIVVRSAWRSGLARMAHRAPLALALTAAGVGALVGLGLGALAHAMATSPRTGRGITLPLIGRGHARKFGKFFDKSALSTLL